MSTDATVFEHRKLWEDALNGERLSALLNGGRLDPEIESPFIDALLAYCTDLRTDNEFGAEQSSKYDLVQKVFSILAKTPAGTAYLNEKSAMDDGAIHVSNMFADLLKYGFGEYPGSELYSAEMMRVGLLAIDDDPVMEQFDERARLALREFMVYERISKALSLIKAGAFDANLPEDTLSNLEFLYGDKPATAPGPQSESPDAAVSGESDASPESPESPGSLKPEALSARVNPPYLNDESLREQIGLMAEAAEKEARDYRLFQDQQTLAQMEWNAIMREHMDMVERSIVHKLRDKIANGLTDFGNPITYPSESIFSHSLARMDANGRVVETYLHFRNGIVGPRVEFPRAEVPDHVYALAALNVRIRGVGKPHINTTFRNPQQAIMFMQKSVDALVNAGYDINDISVAPHLKVAFEAFKAERQVGFTITDANEPDYINPPPVEPRVPLMPEEVTAQQNVDLNEPIRAMHEKVEASDGKITLDKFNDVDVLNAMALISQTGIENEATWQAMQSGPAASPLSWQVAKTLFQQLEADFNQLDPTHSSYNPAKTSDHSCELMAKMGPVILQEMFGVERFGRVYPQLKDWAIAKDAEIEKLQLHEGVASPAEDPLSAAFSTSEPPTPVDDESDDTETRGLAMDEPYDGTDNVHEMIQQELAREAQIDSSSPPSALPDELEAAAKYDHDEVMKMDSMSLSEMGAVPHPIIDEESVESLFQSLSGELPDAPVFSSAMPDDADELNEKPPAQSGGIWDSLSDERKSDLISMDWTDMSDNDIRWVLSMSPKDILSLQRGPGVNYKTIGVADKFETLRHFLSEFYITVEPSHLSKNERDFLSRIPDDVAAKMSDQMQAIRNSLKKPDPNSTPARSGPKL